MIDLIEQHRPKLVELCRRYGVHRLGLLGSALRDDYDPASSDLDFVVEFDQLTIDDAADRYFGLLLDLTDLFGNPVDLVSYSAIRNPFFKQVVDNTRVMLYAA